MTALEYSNQAIPEGINTSDTHPLKELVQLLPAAQLEFLRSHPLSEDRITAIEAQAREQGWRLSGQTTPLPAFIPSPSIDKTRS